ncbi:MAG: lytic transglycosylase domain-containing protein [Pseudomonadota bacterium]
MKGAFFALAAWLSAAAAFAAPSCESLAVAVAQKHGVPVELLIAIAHTESGRRGRDQPVRAWPWTSNIEGQGRYYDTRAAALQHLEEVRDSGVTSFDVGCMQLNYRWHQMHFKTLSDMLDPARNVAYAARYLRELWTETGNWETATRYYHSRNPSLGHAYLDRVRSAMARLETSPKLAAFEGSTPALPVARAQTLHDRRFEPGAPLVVLGEFRPYWDQPSLGVGARPKMP